jgi:DNA-binding NarL/FixJ family response regulator
MTAAPPDPRRTETARMESLVREVNDRIAQLSRQWDASPSRFICECANAGCCTTIELTIEEYAKVRTASTQFVVAAGHEDAENEDVLERCGTYLVVRPRSAVQAALVLDPDGSRAVPHETRLSDEELEVHEPHGRKDDGALMRVVIADDHAPTRFLLRTLLEFVPTLDVVGEASNGRQAVDLVLSEHADIVLLDVELPLMDGVLAAELIGSHRPTTRIILHTAHADPVKQARVQALGLPLLVKQGFEETVAAVSAAFDSTREGVPGERAVEAIVLAALAAHGGRPMVVVSADGQIPFYTSGAAELLDLPLPAEAITLAELREAHPLVDDLGQPISRDDSPLEQALVSAAPQSGELSEILPNGALRTYHLNAVPMRDPDGRFLGVASFLTVLAETRPTRSEINAS